MKPSLRNSFAAFTSIFVIGCASAQRSAPEAKYENFDRQAVLAKIQVQPLPVQKAQSEGDASPDEVSAEEIQNAPEELIEPLEIDPQTAAEPALPAENAEQVTADLINAEKGLEKDVAHIEVPTEINARVQTWIKYFTGRGRERFQRYLDRGEQYRPLIEQVLAETGVPKELFYLALIESGFQTSARSHAGAQGIWQFIRGTGRHYKLRVDPGFDERRDPVRSTRAAATYLRDLNNIFNSWHLAMAAYNAGEYRIIGAVRRSGTRSFWDLAAQRKLPKETMNYVPKFLAALTIGTYPERYGFQINRVAVYPEVRALSVRGGVSLNQVAQSTGMSLASLRMLNPHLQRGVTPRVSGYEIWVPKSSPSAFDTEVASLYPTRTVKPAKKPGRKIASKRYVKTTKRTPPRVHRVSKGDTLQSIARRHRMSVGQLKRLNSLRSSRILPGQRLKVLTREGDRTQS